MTDSGPAGGDPVIAQIMNVFTALQGRIEGLERQVQELTAKNTRTENELGSLNLWHNSRLFGRIAKLYPKRRSVIFYHRDFFSDNIKYAYLRCVEVAAKHGFECHFLMHDAEHRQLMVKAGLPCFPSANEWTMEHYERILSAKVLVVQDDFTPFDWQPLLSYFLLQGAKLVQLWHGIPMKQIGLFYKTSGGASNHEFKFAATGPADVLVAPGKNFEDEWRVWASYREFAPVGYPRNDVLMRDATAHELVNVDTDLLRDVKAARDAGRKVIFYGPTFRDGGGLAWFGKAHMDVFSQWCREKGYLFLTKPHPYDQASFTDLAKSMPDIRFANPKSDIYPLLRYADTFITDYSSLVFDFLLTDKPVVFYRPDHGEYLAKCRNMLPHHERMMVGPVATDIDVLKRSIDEVLSGKDAWEKPRRTLRDELYDHRDAKAGERVVDVILKQLDAPQELPAGWAP